MAGFGLLLTPVDIVLAPFERRLYARAPAPSRPLVFVCGPPRSGTTLVGQTLINMLDVAYPNNLSSLFPRAPIVANRLLRRWVRERPGSYQAFYGKSTGLGGANDGLPLWDRWLGADRARAPDALTPGSEDALPRFFGALEALYGKPLVNKVNRLNTCAHLVAPLLPQAQFVFLQRDPLMLAQSLYIARQQIVGDMGRAYGTQHPDAAPEDPVEDVCRQVRFHERALERECAQLAPARRLVLSYEDFCRDPAALVARLRAGAPDLLPRAGAPVLAPFTISERHQLAPDLLERMRRRLEELGAGQVVCDSLQD